MHAMTLGFMGQNGPATSLTLPPSFLEKKFGQVPIPRVARFSEELHQGKLDFGVPGNVTPLVGTIDGSDGIRHLDGGVQHFSLFRGVKVGDCRLDEMTGRVELAVPVGALPLFRRIVGNELRHHFVDPSIDLAFELRIGAFLQGVGRPFDGFESDGRNGVPGFSAFFEHVRNRDPLIPFDPRLPELARDVDSRQGYGLGRIIRWRWAVKMAADKNDDRTEDQGNPSEFYLHERFKAVRLSVAFSRAPSPWSR